MKKRYKLSVFIFRRDLRVEDNAALIAASKSSDYVLPCFIFDERQCHSHPYFSQPAFDFMINSISDLRDEISKQGGHLYFFKGIAEDVIEKLIVSLPIDAVFINRDYTPFSIKRDKRILEISKKHNRDFFSLSDTLLNEPETVLKSDASPYVVFTAFARKAREYLVAKPKPFLKTDFFNKDIAIENKNIFSDFLATNPIMQGGRKAGLALLSSISDLVDYEKNRDFPALNYTSHLSAHHKFGTVSIRETYHVAMRALGQSAMLISELYWRDFFTHIAFHFPYVFENAFHAQYRQMPWSLNEADFQAWCEGNTGFPIIDAGMRELNETGYMHNRVRMITASFLVKDLHINWQWGERYFASRLVDYDPAVNNGNWQWAASTGCDAQPYFRIFNPWLQQKRFDLNGDYIKRWVPELKSVSPEILHKPGAISDLNVHYRDPMLDHAVASKTAKQLYGKREKA